MYFPFFILAWDMKQCSRIRKIVIYWPFGQNILQVYEFFFVYSFVFSIETHFLPLIFGMVSYKCGRNKFISTELSFRNDTVFLLERCNLWFLIHGLCFLYIKRLMDFCLTRHNTNAVRFWMLKVAGWPGQVHDLCFSMHQKG